MSACLKHSQENGQAQEQGRAQNEVIPAFISTSQESLQSENWYNKRKQWKSCSEKIYEQQIQTHLKNVKLTQKNEDQPKNIIPKESVSSQNAVIKTNYLKVKWKKNIGGKRSTNNRDKQS